METFGKFMTVVLALIAAPIINGFVVMKLWGWFVVPTFEIHQLRLVEVIGLLFIVNFIIIGYKKTDPEEKPWEEFAKRIIFLIFAAAFMLFSGWLVSKFM